jgi:DNA-binding GntR family transcriptional regulator
MQFDAKAPRPSTKSGFVYDQIRAAILSGKLQPDQRLRLAELASQFQLSAMPVREALRMLQKDGLITMADHRGATVANLSWRHAFEFVEVRTLLEIHAALRALPHHTVASIRELRKLIEQMSRPDTMGNSDRFTQLNRQFHTALFAPGPNAVLKQEIEDLWDQVWRVRRLSIFLIDPARSSGAHTEHQAIVEAVAANDPKQLERAMTRHRNQTMRTWAKIVEESEAGKEGDDNAH